MHAPHIFGDVPPRPPARQSTTIEAVTGVAQVAIAIAAWVQLRDPRAWWILGLGIAWLGVAFGRPLARWLATLWRRRHDNRAARRAVRELRSLTRTFGKLVNPDNSDTLQAALQEGFKNYHGMLERLHVPSVHLFNEMLHNLHARLEKEPPDTAHMLRALSEFYTVISAHSTQCIQPVFRSMPKEAREILTPDARGPLNSYRERYVGFHATFTSFAEDLGASLQTARLDATYYVFRPDALTT